MTSPAGRKLIIVGAGETAQIAYEYFTHDSPHTVAAFAVEGAHLKERESKILRLYFGLDGEEPMTLEQIGSLLGITRERVRQIKEKALRRLRHVSRARALESYLG